MFTKTKATQNKSHKSDNSNSIERGKSRALVIQFSVSSIRYVKGLFVLMIARFH